ncbi:SOUL family heme-binding protein [Carnobacterium sp. TMP28]|uniref:SOUL family heme-binding protein n=1 Tax=Carnobacterium sp. TMP28 TaxID=3397060 RepID=UPI0039E126C9
MSKYETPNYDIVMKEEEFEIRKYADFFIVEYENSDDPEIKNGFGSLFKYISSDNEEKEKISMTVPVIREETGKNQKMAFVVPGKYRDKIPEPTNSNLTIKKFEEGLFGSIRYSGFSTTAKELKMKNNLEQWLLEKGYQQQSTVLVASYNAPLVPPMLRRNEILVRIHSND